MCSGCIVGVGQALPAVEVCACTKNLTVPGHNSSFYARAQGEETEGSFGVQLCLLGRYSVVKIARVRVGELAGTWESHC